jgi:hypothetical protein
MAERPEPGVRGDRDAIVTGQEPDAPAPDRVLETPDESTPAGAEHPFEPSVTDDTARPDSP